MADKFRRVCVVGVGLIGGSMALSMRRMGLADEIVGVGRRIENLKNALQLGAVTGYTRKIEQGVEDADLVILAVPVRAMPELVKSARGHFQPGAILTDVGSTKAKMIKAIEPLLAPGVDFIPAHPIAGREKSGAEYSDPEIFQGRWTIITPAKSSSPKGVQRIRRLWRALGAKVELMAPEVHDRILASVSHLPHIVAYGLVGALLKLDRKTPLLRFSAGGFRDFTRIAESSPEMWRDICLENKTEILRAMEEYEKELRRMKTLLKQEQGKGLLKFFETCRQVKGKIRNSNG